MRPFLLSLTLIKFAFIKLELFKLALIKIVPIKIRQFNHYFFSASRISRNNTMSSGVAAGAAGSAFFIRLTILTI